VQQRKILKIVTTANANTMLNDKRGVIKKKQVKVVKGSIERKEVAGIQSGAP